MCSFDVSTLFTNVPLDETIQICLDMLYALPDAPTLPRSVLRVLLEYATKKSHFIFDGQYYDQINGVAMGSPLGPVLTNIFMCHFEEKWVLSNNTRPSICFRYVDDTFTLFDNINTENQFLHYLNSCHANIKFIVEFEENNTISFLDIFIKRNNHVFSTSIYRKKTFTGLYTKWDSFTPRKYKINLIRTLTFRCFRIYSSPSLLSSSLAELKKLLLQNGYPSGVLNYNINDVLNRQQNRPKQPITTVPKKEVLLILPSLGFQNRILTKQVKACINKFYCCFDLRVVFQSTHRIKSLFPYKDRLTRAQMSRVVYKASCWGCQEFYIGKTKRRLHDRKTEHFKSITSSNHSSAIADHVTSTGHNMKWDHFEILARGWSDTHAR